MKERGTESCPVPQAGQAAPAGETPRREHSDVPNQVEAGWQVIFSLAWPDSMP